MSVLLNKLADKFENKFSKYAATEVDSTNVTLTVRPKANEVVEANAVKLLQPVAKVIMDKATKALNSDPSIELFGMAKLGGLLMISANKNSGKWKITNLIVGHSVGGDFSQDRDILKALASAAAALKSLLVVVLEAEFARLSDSWVDADTITNVKVMVNEKSVGI